MTIRPADPALFLPRDQLAALAARENRDARVTAIADGFRRAADDADAAYELTNALDGLLDIAAALAPEPHQVERMRAAVAEAAERAHLVLALPVDIVREGLEAADVALRLRFVDRTWPALDPSERRDVEMRLKLLRNLAHSLALRRDLAGRAWRHAGTVFDPALAGSLPAPASIRRLREIFDRAAGATDPLPPTVDGLRGLVALVAAPHRSRVTTDQRAALAHSIRSAAPAIADAAREDLALDDIRDGLAAAVEFVAIATSDEGSAASASRAFAEATADHVALLADRLDIVVREHRLAARDPFRHALSDQACGAFG